MKKYAIILVMLISSCSVCAQKDVNELFKINLYVINRTVTVEKWGTDTSYYLEYSIKNISNDTLVYITNSCFYYNHYVLKTGEQEFDLNADGACTANALTHHTIAPGEVFNMSEWITAMDLNVLKNGSLNVTLQVPLVYDTRGYRVDGRNFVENEQYLVFNGETIVVEILVINRKTKKVHSHNKG